MEDPTCLLDISQLLAAQGSLWACTWRWGTLWLHCSQRTVYCQLEELACKKSCKIDSGRARSTWSLKMFCSPCSCVGAFSWFFSFPTSFIIYAYYNQLSSACTIFSILSNDKLSSLCHLEASMQVWFTCNRCKPTFNELWHFCYI